MLLRHAGAPRGASHLCSAPQQQEGQWQAASHQCQGCQRAPGAARLACPRAARSLQFQISSPCAICAVYAVHCEKCCWCLLLFTRSHCSCSQALTLTAGTLQLRSKITYHGRPASAVQISLAIPAEASPRSWRQGDICVQACGMAVSVSVPSCGPWHQRLPFHVDGIRAQASLQHGEGEGSAGAPTAGLLKPGGIGANIPCRMFRY